MPSAARTSLRSRRAGAAAAGAALAAAGAAATPVDGWSVCSSITATTLDPGCRSVSPARAADSRRPVSVRMCCGCSGSGSIFWRSCADVDAQILHVGVRRPRPRAGCSWCVSTLPACCHQQCAGCRTRLGDSLTSWPPHRHDAGAPDRPPDRRCGRPAARPAAAGDGAARRGCAPAVRPCRTAWSHSRRRPDPAPHLARLVGAAGQHDDRHASQPASRSCRITSRPSMSGRPRSSTTRSAPSLGERVQRLRRPSRPRSRRSPGVPRPVRRKRRIAGSSSTTRMRSGLSAVMPPSPARSAGRGTGRLMVNTAPERSVRLPAVMRAAHGLDEAAADGEARARCRRAAGRPSGRDRTCRRCAPGLSGGMPAPSSSTCTMTRRAVAASACDQ